MTQTLHSVTHPSSRAHLQVPLIACHVSHDGTRTRSTALAQPSHLGRHLCLGRISASSPAVEGWAIYPAHSEESFHLKAPPPSKPSCCEPAASCRGAVSLLRERVQCDPRHHPASDQQWLSRQVLHPLSSDQPWESCACLSCLIQAYLNDTVPKQIDAFGGLRQRDWWPSLWPFHKYEPSLAAWTSGGWAMRTAFSWSHCGWRF